jgi:hypothetical protein
MHVPVSACFEFSSATCAARAFVSPGGRRRRYLLGEMPYAATKRVSPEIAPTCEILNSDIRPGTEGV